MSTRKSRLGVLITTISIAAITACNKDKDVAPAPDPGSSTDTTLKAASSFPIGMAIDYSLFKNNTSYKSIVAREADQVTFGYNMKHGAIVKNDGSLDYSTADELLNLSEATGLQVFGHTLGWHANQNATYLKSLTNNGGGINNINLLPQGDFEAGTGTSGTGNTLFTGWNLLIGGTAAGSYASVSGNGSSRALEATVTTPGSNAYDVQAIGPGWTAAAGTQYRISIDIKASVTGGKVRLVNQNNQYQQNDIVPATSWATYTWTLNAIETSPILRLNFPVAGVYTIDNIKINEVTAGGPLPAAQAAANIDSALSRFIRTTVTRYKDKIKAWDVVNEIINDGTGTIRTSGVAGPDNFYWAEYLGRDFALKAFNYAKAADPSALLFINDYNLESDSKKLDSLIAYVNELKSKGAKIDGIGTQMHISINTSRSGIDNMFVKLAATGLKIRVSELDIRMNPANSTGFTPSTQNLNDQAEMYRYVVQSFKANIPASQRNDITVWGVSDSDSWIVTVLHNQDFPLLFNSSYVKKPAFTNMLHALKP